MVESGLDFLNFEIELAPSEIPADQCQANSALLGRFFLYWAAVTLKGLGEFQNIKF